MPVGGYRRRTSVTPVDCHTIQIARWRLALIGAVRN
jgi:hypothetical protein